ncbi:DUF1345 domain-containing protein [Leifsonia sp. Leaf264]|uniref:DUF1345 domain-containing protein n=1 Tax=Leifsonia sp. Leaf264 TaxID=1736314 RepID=UPI00070196F9|nr:DUF1345 domain-containing protein [Leifsonia sp. Leaf264]KQP01149.1 hypothetical protein ASF30_00445 [Leifsonia sp. Leaf264]
MERHPSRTTQTENRWPVAVALLFALALYAFLPASLFPEQRLVVIGLALLLMIPLVIMNPRRLNQETRWSRVIGLVLACLLVASNQVTIVALIGDLVAGSRDTSGLLLSSLQVWVTNAIAFALLYWELDRGGPVARALTARDQLPPADFRFPQDEDDDAVTEVATRSSKVEDWMPSFIDYLYTSVSTSMAYSATDAMPLSHRFKLLNLLQAFGSFVILALVIARAVNILA